MANNRPMGVGGGMGGFSGHFTRTGRAIFIYFMAVFLVGGLLTNWMEVPWFVQMLLHPLNSGRFGVWQPATHLLVYYPTFDLGFLLSMFMFWLFAWQVEAQIGRSYFLFLVFGIPFLSGLLGLPFSMLEPFQTPLAGFSLVLDVLIVAFCMMNRSAVINFMFVWRLRASQLIWVLIGFQLLTLAFRQNPWFPYHMISIGLTYLMFRFGFSLDPEVWRLRWKSRQLKRKQSRFSVIPGGRGDGDDGPLYH